MNKKSLIKSTLTLALSAMIFSSCTSDNEEELFPVVEIVEEDETTISLEDDVQPIIENSCAVTGCHVSGSQSPDLSTKEGTFAKKARVNARAVTAKTMPPGGALSQTDRDVIETWITEGGTNN